MPKKKKTIIITSAVIAAVIICAVILYLILKSDNNAANADESVFVSSVAQITGQESAGLFNRYSGVIEPQETMDIEKSSDKTVKDILVKEGDAVSVGTALFSYDTDEISIKLSQAQLELESLTNDITALYSQVSALEKERNNASADEKLNYTTQIQETQNEARRAEYNKKSKSIEIEQIKKSLNNATVYSELSGVVKTINENGEMDNMTGELLPFMTIMATGNYRVKGKINETNAMYLSDGMPVLIRSRVDDEQTWTGTITKIDFENPVTDNNNGMYFGESNGEQSTNYPFYIELDSADNLILGQHVFIEPDFGQSEPKEGLWLQENYFVFEADTAYIWVKDSKDRLEKRKVETGDYDSELLEYEIISGLESTDYIAWPNERLKEGMTCNIGSVSDMMNSGMDGAMDEGMDAGMDGAMDEGIDGAMDEGMDTSMDAELNSMDESNTTIEDEIIESDSSLQGSSEPVKEAE